jgi:hypothetical protein
MSDSKKEKTIEQLKQDVKDTHAKFQRAMRGSKDRENKLKDYHKALHALNAAEKAAGKPETQPARDATPEKTPATGAKMGAGNEEDKPKTPSTDSEE